MSKELEFIKNIKLYKYESDDFALLEKLGFKKSSSWALERYETNLCEIFTGEHYGVSDEFKNFFAETRKDVGKGMLEFADNLNNEQKEYIVASLNSLLGSEIVKKVKVEINKKYFVGSNDW